MRKDRRADGTAGRDVHARPMDLLLSALPLLGAALGLLGLLVLLLGALVEA